VATIVRNSLWIMVGLTLGHVSAGAIQYDVTPLGGNSYQYTYSLSGITFQLNEQLDIRFDPSSYGIVSNGVAPTGYSVTLLQPNNPPGDPGDYSALAQVNNPSTAGSFSVQFVYLGAGQPGSQPFFLNQFDSQGFFEYTSAAGYTSQQTQQPSEVPEPSALWLIGSTLLLGGLWTLHRRQSSEIGRSCPRASTEP
jgi:hypothetical protein